MQRSWRSSVQLPGAVVAVALGLSVFPALGWSQSTASSVQNQAWAARLTSLLRLTPPQQAALKAFMDTSARSADLTAPSAAQVRAMTMVERFDHWASETVTIQTHAQTDALALHRFYATLSPEQRAQFDEETRFHGQPANVAADVAPSAGSEQPDYRLPSRTEADWLVKPTAENIARVYPSAALKAHMDGRATLHCRVDVDGYLADCVVTGEQPLGQGFGNAALEITGYMRMQPATSYGVPVPGEVSVPITFAQSDPD
jgi:TonB family protein